MIADVYNLHLSFGDVEENGSQAHSRAVLPGFKTWSSSCRLRDLAVPLFSSVKCE